MPPAIAQVVRSVDVDLTLDRCWKDGGDAGLVARLPRPSGRSGEVDGAGGLVRGAWRRVVVREAARVRRTGHCICVIYLSIILPSSQEMKGTENV